MAIDFGKGSLGQIKSKQGFVYQITWDDLLWLARSLMGEDDSGGLGTEAVCWAYAQRAVVLRVGSGGPYQTLAGFMQAYSQPINKIWRRDGERCRPLLPNESPFAGNRRWNYSGRDECSEARLRRRDVFAQTVWSQIPETLQEIAYKWATAEINNPIPKAEEFAVPSVAKGKVDRGKLFLVWDVLGRPEGSSARGGNAFYSSPKTKNWPENFVFIEYNGKQTGEEPAPSSGDNRRNQPSSSQVSRPQPQPVVPPEQPPDERIEALTQGRTEPPVQKKNYYLEQGEDTSSALGIFPRVDILANPNDLFYNQVLSLKAKSTLELNSTVPYLQITTLDENGNLVNLNEEIFSVPPNDLNFFTGDDYPERPLASIVSFDVNVQSPSVGGPTGITVCKLKLKIHNPFIIHPEHEQGKFLSWMMRQGFYLKIRYGISGGIPDEFPDFSGTGDDAFATRTESFFVAQHEVQVNMDLTLDATFTLLPASSKLFNQVLVGESIPAEIITNDDVQVSVRAVIANNTDTEQVNQLVADLQIFQREFNTEARKYYGTDTFDDNGTLGSILLGAISNNKIITQSQGYNSIRVRNLVEGIKTIQSNLLSRRFDEVFKVLSYKYRFKSGISIIAANMGPLFYTMIEPEISKIVRIISLTSEELNEPNQTKRNKVKIVFGNFNANAGEWAGKPISTFPINIEEIIDFIRSERQVGRFSDSLNIFIGRLASIVNERDYFLGREDAGTNSSVRRLEVPQIKYRFFEDRSDDSSWIMYVYDNKAPLVDIVNLLSEIREGTAENGNARKLTRDEIIFKCLEKRIPTIEMGANSSIVKSMNASTTSDDMLMSHNLFLANTSIGQRRVDGTNNQIAPGINAEFLAGVSNQEVIRSTELILPLKVSLTTFGMVNAIIFGHMYVFFPVNEFSALYTIYELNHSIDKTGFQSSMNLQINLTGQNRAIAPVSSNSGTESSLRGEIDRLSIE